MTDLHTVIRRMGIGLLAVGVSSTPAWAQQAAAKKTATVQPDFQRASAVSGRVTGLVRDDRGQGVGGVVISALGTTTATVTSTAGHATLAVSEPGHLTNGAFSLAEPLRVQFGTSAWNGPTSNENVDVTFKQLIKSTDPLRTGTYSRPVTFTLSTTQP